MTSELDKYTNRGSFPLERVSVSSWLAIRTRSRHEKTVLGQLLLHGIESYLPIVRRKQANYTFNDVVLIPGYCFVSSTSNHRVVLSIVGVCGFVTFQNEPAEIPQSEIEILHQATDPKYMAREYTGFSPRQAVKIVGTPFDGYIATVDEIAGNWIRVILPMSIGRSITVRLSAENIEPLPSSNIRPSIMTEIPNGVN